VEEAKDVLAGKKLIYATGAIEYRDVFPNTKRHRLDWCVTLNPYNIETGQFSRLIEREEVKDID